MTTIPEAVLVRWSTQLFSLVNLAWTYINTVLDIVAQMKIQALKPLSRKVRALKAEYDRFRWPHVLGATEARETARAEAFEEYFEKDFKILFYGIDTEVKKKKLNADYSVLAIAVHQAITICNAVKILARRIDRELVEKYQMPRVKYGFVQTEFLRVCDLLPYFAGDAYRPNMEICAKTAEILANRMESVEIRKI